MNRYVCWLALLGVAAVPDWASAFNRRYWCGPVYYEPVYYAPPPVVYYPPPCLPVYVAAPCPPAANSTPTAATARTPKPADPPKPMPESVRPAGGITPAPRTPAPKDDIEFRPSPPPAVSPAPKPADPPKLEVPKFEPKAPGLELPKGEPKSPGLEIPPAPTSPAPASPGLTLPPVTPDPTSPLIPSPVPPVSPEPKKTETLPPLVLPPESPVRPPTTSRSSPLSAVTAQVFAAYADGARDQPRAAETAKAAEAGRGARTDGLKKVSFFNHTDRDLNLTIDGKDVKLPARTYINARLGASFRWKHGDNEPETATVPADAAGLDVVLKE
ncbi:MAG TPA: hypothetical protein VMZ71_16530, partial [Gemmataceae bacterium]|nr:hypothetical protein [Gemmataceae bacterium]